MDGRGAWNTKYWDIVDQIYWAPQYMGMKSIPQKYWRVEADTIAVPAERVNKSGPLYTRSRSADVHKSWMLRQEEVLNHVFDLTFAISPDSLIGSCFARPLGIRDPGPYESLGREIRQRYGWTRSENVTQHDGLFVSPNSALGVEIKLRARSSPAQVVKYASLFAWEEMRAGPLDHLGLLYILEEPADTRHWRECGLTGPQVDSGLLDSVDIATLPRKIRELIGTDRSKVSSALDRMVLGAITWGELRDGCVDFCQDLDDGRPGDQTLIRLVSGLIAQIDAQVQRSDA